MKARLRRETRFARTVCARPARLGYREVELEHRLQTTKGKKSDNMDVIRLSGGNCLVYAVQNSGLMLRMARKALRSKEVAECVIAFLCHGRRDARHT